MFRRNVTVNHVFKGFFLNFKNSNKSKFCFLNIFKTFFKERQRRIELSSQMEMDVNRLHSFAIKSKKERKNILKFFFCKKTKEMKIVREGNCKLELGSWLDWIGSSIICRSWLRSNFSNEFCNRNSWGLINFMLVQHYFSEKVSTAKLNFC